MGSFSWLKADKLTKINNIVYGQSFKFLIPSEFGGGYIKEKYQDYGDLGRKEDGTPKYDMYELLAFWNKDMMNPLTHEPVSLALQFKDEFPLLKEVDKYTDHNRAIGITIGCYDEEVDKLKYPLKLVSASCKLTYEEILTPSYYDPNQGFFPTYR